eukprot:TRINITY_DN17403_c0_g1_i1.p1 TRINITY_DN17403_c0_g1~~TRINITY_DN17403_c0_g1_i1.p1  ORF type:complete len:122 (+),score=11.26 TRINITY_DN17403_c0_g1_i1:152-517(+)
MSLRCGRAAVVVLLLVVLSLSAGSLSKPTINSFDSKLQSVVNQGQTEGDVQQGEPMSKTSWPELVGATGLEAKDVIERESPNKLSIFIVFEDAIVTMDYNPLRVRIYVNKEAKVVRPPMVG